MFFPILNIPHCSDFLYLMKKTFTNHCMLLHIVCSVNRSIKKLYFYLYVKIHFFQFQLRIPITKWRLHGLFNKLFFVLYHNLGIRRMFPHLALYYNDITNIINKYKIPYNPFSHKLYLKSSTINHMNQSSFLLISI